jgi:hypothetical protein
VKPYPLLAGEVNSTTGLVVPTTMADKSEIYHVDEETLDRYALGKLSEDGAAPVEEHLLVCHACQDRLDAADTFIAAFRDAAPLVAKNEPVRQPWYRRLFDVPKTLWIPALAATAVLAIVIQTRPSLDRTQVVELRTYRGAEAAPQVESGSLLQLRLGAEGLKSGQPYRVEIANARGVRVWYGALAWSDSVAEVHVPKLLGAGQYWVRLYDMQLESEPVREYALTIR